MRPPDQKILLKIFRPSKQSQKDRPKKESQKEKIQSKVLRNHCFRSPCPPSKCHEHCSDPVEGLFDPGARSPRARQCLIPYYVECPYPQKHHAVTEKSWGTPKLGGERFRQHHYTIYKQEKEKGQEHDYSISRHCDQR